MADYYRLKELGCRLAAGTYVVRAEELEPVAAATSLLQAAEEEAERIRQEAQRAFRQQRIRGYTKGLERARIVAARRLLQEGKALDETLRQIEQDLASLVISSIRKLVDGYHDTGLAEGLVRSALKQMRREKRIELSVPPHYFEHVRDAVGRIVREFPEIDLVDVVEDPSLKPPRVVAESCLGRVDANLGEGIEGLEAILRHAARTASREAASEPPGTRGP